MNFILALVMLFVMLIPYILFFVVCFILCLILMWLITTKSIKSIALKILTIIVILLFVFIIVGTMNTQEPDYEYIQMTEKNDKKELIGLSKEQVIAILGKPQSEFEYKDKEEKIVYKYSAGIIRREWFYGKTYRTDYYELKVFFNHEDKVAYTNIEKMDRD